MERCMYLNARPQNYSLRLDRGPQVRGKIGRWWMLVGVAMLVLMAPGTATAVTVISTGDANALVQGMLKGPAIQVTGATFSGAAGASGTYVKGPLSMEDGVVLSTGDVSLAPYVDGTKGLSTSWGGGGSSLCSKISPAFPNYDAALLTINFDLAAGYDGIQFSFVMASDEYPDYVGTPFNDAFGIFLDGVNIAVDQSGNALNISGPFFASSSVITATGTEFNGSTPRLLASAALTGGTTGHTLQIVTCDVADDTIDTGAFISALEGCHGSCNQTFWCGDGKVNGTEECDDGNNVAGDGCSIDCKLEGAPKLPAGDGCASATECSSGFCVDSFCCLVASCSSASDDCHIASCQAKTGLCGQQAKADGSACNDGSACTRSDLCLAGVCTGGDPVMCSAPDECHAAGSCDSATGMCSEPVKLEGAVCSISMCDGGSCMADAGSAAPDPMEHGGCGCRIYREGDAGPTPIAFNVFLLALVALAAWHCRVLPKRRNRPVRPIV